MTLALLGAAALAAPAPAGASRPGGTAYRAHAFPVVGPHSTRGPIGEFGAPRSGGRTHEGIDIVAPCGAGLRAVSSGRVRRRGYDPVLYGNFVLIHGAGERRSYFYAHLRRPAPVHPGQRLFAGERIGAVGRTGNARTVGCHLHFEVWRRGRPVDPAPWLRKLRAPS
jgi:murein DD-endopeptidase MepM/ murein hydrolase activator NlpD